MEERSTPTAEAPESAPEAESHVSTNGRDGGGGALKKAGIAAAVVGTAAVAVGIARLSQNRPEWGIADLAILSLGAVNVPLYSTLPPPQVRHIVADSGAVALIVEDEKQLQKAAEVRGDLPELRHVILIEAEGELP